LLGFQVYCQTGQTSENASDKNNAEKEVAKNDLSDAEIRNIIINEDFYEGDRKYKAIMSLPKKKLVPILEKLRSEGIEEGEINGTPSKLIELKSAYLLCKLNVNYPENAQFIIDEADPPLSAEKRDYFKTNAIEYVGRLISSGDKTLLPVVFRVAPKSDAGFTTSINSILYFELTNSTKTFLQYLLKEPEKNKKAVYRLISFKRVSEKDLEKVRSNLKELSKEANLKNIALEVLAEINK
jgi:hypothetical protein